MAWAADQRQLWIAWCLNDRGFIQRAHLMDQFKISVAQASLDLGRFMREQPGRIEYDKTTKRYVAAAAS